MPPRSGEASDDAPQREAEWTDPDRGKVLLGDYARTWIKERPGLRPKTVELYTWLLERHIVPGLGEVPIGRLRWGEVIALRRSDIDLNARTVRVREQLIELGGGRHGAHAAQVAGRQAHCQHPLGHRSGPRRPPRPVHRHRRGRVRLGKRGAYLCGGDFRREAKWAEALKEMGVKGLHFHDLRHTGNTLAAQSGASLADLKARMATTAAGPRSFTSTPRETPTGRSPMP
ncbi:hypothetical protein [Microbispora sp. H10836]|uniref:hypothetical protein n=1 Tax=Microbispora sp. H10836 TaxID=2729106 RepID=UPI001B8B5AE1|nr:hypothetical protein [Microbispora sp. H10836]